MQRITVATQVGSIAIAILSHGLEKFALRRLREALAARFVQVGLVLSLNCFGETHSMENGMRTEMEMHCELE